MAGNSQIPNTRRGATSKSPDGRLGAFLLVYLWGIALVDTQGILDYRVISLQYLDNTTGTVYPGWNTVVTTNASVTNVRWTTSMGTLVSFNTVENNYLWMSLIPSTATVNGIVTNRTAFCLPMIQNTANVTYTNDISVLQEKRVRRIVSNITNFEARYIPECDFILEFISPKSQLPGIVTLGSEYYLPSAVFYSIIPTQTKSVYGPVYFNSDYCGILCTQEPTSATFWAQVWSRPCTENCCWYLPSFITTCTTPVFKDASGIKKIISMATSVVYNPGDVTAINPFLELTVTYNSTYKVGYNNFGQMDLDGRTLIGQQSIGMDPKFKYRPPTITYQQL